MVPTFGLSDQVTLVLALPSTVVENCCDPPARRFTELGDTDTLTVGCSVPKNKPLTTAFGGLVLITRRITWPLRFHTRYSPGTKLATDRVSRRLLLASITSTLSVRRLLSQSTR